MTAFPLASVALWPIHIINQLIKPNYLKQMRRHLGKIQVNLRQAKT